MTQKLWGGRFAESTANIVETFTSSIAFDSRLFQQDINGSVAHSKMLAQAGILTGDEADAIIGGLEQIRKEFERGEIEFQDILEDVHMHIESRLFEIIGKTAQKLHTARSRNDQVAVDVRMYLREQLDGIVEQLFDLQRTLLLMADEYQKIIMPGYTHLQRAQPILLSHHLMAYFEMFGRDRERMTDCRKRMNLSPLGAAAMAGTTYPIDRGMTARELHFEGPTRNSIDSVSDRDFALEFVSAAAIVMMHFSRLSEEIILWASSEFKFIELPDAYATGSSIMPQKKNPDVAELTRGKTGKVYGNLMELLTIMKALPLAYNRDMQEDKPALFETVDTLKACIQIYCQMLPKIVFKAERMYQAATTGFVNATDLADYLVTMGMPFREAHHVVGQSVEYALGQNKELDQLTLAELQQFSHLIEADIFDFLKVETVVNRRNSYGGTGAEAVALAIKEAHHTLRHVETALGKAK